MEKTIYDLLSDLESEVKSFKEEEAEKVSNQEKRLKNLETSYNVLASRPFTSPDTVEHCQHKKYLEDYLRKGNTSSVEIKSNGFPLQQTLVNSIHDWMKKISPMRQIASVSVISTDCITYITNGTPLEAQWVSTDEEINDADVRDNVITTNINTYELYTQPKITQKVLDDPSIDAERWLIEQAAFAFTQIENETFIKGDGKSKPHGILAHNKDSDSNKIAKMTTAEKGKISTADIVKLYHSLPREFTVNGTFLMNSATIQMIRGLKYEQTGHYVFQPSLAIGQPDTLMGIPVIECAEMPMINDSGTGETCTCPIIFGDFRRGYQIVDRNEMRVLRDPYSTKPYISFYITKRVGAEVTNPDAFALLEMKS